MTKFSGQDRPEGPCYVIARATGGPHPTVSFVLTVLRYPRLR